MLFCFINAKIISKVLLTYSIMENNIIHHALYLKVLKKYGKLFFIKSFFFPLFSLRNFKSFSNLQYAWKNCSKICNLLHFVAQKCHFILRVGHDIITKFKVMVAIKINIFLNEFLNLQPYARNGTLCDSRNFFKNFLYHLKQISCGFFFEFAEL